MAKKYASSNLKRLIKILTHIQMNDKMAKRDADNILVGAIVLNYKYLQSTLKKKRGIKSHQKIKLLLLKRITDIFKIMA